MARRALPPWLSNPFERRPDPLLAYQQWFVGQPWLHDALIREANLARSGNGNRRKAPTTQARLIDWLAEQASRPGPVFVYGVGRNKRPLPGMSQQARCYRPVDRQVALPIHYDARAPEGETLGEVESEALHQALVDLREKARQAPDRHYLVASLDEGLPIAAGEALRRLFLSVSWPENVHLPAHWLPHDEGRRPRVLVRGHHAETGLDEHFARVDAVLQRLAHPTIISAADTASQRFAEVYACERGYPFERVPALWRAEGKHALKNHCQRLTARATHMVVFWDGFDETLRQLIQMARGRGLRLRVLRRQTD